jgi:hypothetical protein
VGGAYAESTAASTATRPPSRSASAAAAELAPKSTTLTSPGSASQERTARSWRAGEPSGGGRGAEKIVTLGGGGALPSSWRRERARDDEVEAYSTDATETSAMRTRRRHSASPGNVSTKPFRGRWKPPPRRGGGRWRCSIWAHAAWGRAVAVSSLGYRASGTLVIDANLKAWKWLVYCHIPTCKWASRLPGTTCQWVPSVTQRYVECLLEPQQCIVREVLTLEPLVDPVELSLRCRKDGLLHYTVQSWLGLEARSMMAYPRRYDGGAVSSRPVFFSRSERRTKQFSRLKERIFFLNRRFVWIVSTTAPQTYKTKPCRWRIQSNLQLQSTCSCRSTR